MSKRKTITLVQVDNDEKFRAYAAGLATALKHRIEIGEQLNEREKKWLGQFGRHQLKTCQKLIDAYALDQITARLAQHPT